MRGANRDEAIQGFLTKVKNWIAAPPLAARDDVKEGLKEKMSEGNSLINLGDLSKPATVLIEKVSDAIGWVVEPYQVKRVAKAEVEAEKIRALGKIELSGLQERAMHRMIAEETIKQENIENITAKAVKELKEDAKPENLERDWVANFL